MLFAGALDSKKAVMGTCNAAAICCKVLTLGEVLPFSIRLKVLTFRPLRSASARMDKFRSFRNSRKRWPTFTSGTVLVRVLLEERGGPMVPERGLVGAVVLDRGMATS